MPSRVIGVDGGGTHTGIGFADGGVDSMQSQRVDRPGRVTHGQEQAAAESLARSIREASASASLEDSVDAIVFGLAGAGDPSVAAKLLDALQTVFPKPKIQVTTDAAIAFADAFPDGEGILLSAGTGSIALGSAGDSMERTGGNGWRFGDDGSGYWIGQAALNAVQRANDGRGVSTALVSQLESANTHLFNEPRDVALLTADVCQAAAAGDTVAAQILERAAELLAQHVITLHERLGGNLAIAFNGGVLDPHLPIRTRVIDRIRRHGLRGETMQSKVDPIRGAVRLALAAS